MIDTTPFPSQRPADRRPSIAEIAVLTARLRELTTGSSGADAGERAAFLADKRDLIARITAASTNADPPPSRTGREAARTSSYADDALHELARARAADGGYLLIGPSARTWRADPATGQPVEPVAEAEHRAVRYLLARETLDATEPAWTDGPDGRPDVVSAVILASEPAPGDEDLTAGDVARTASVLDTATARWDTADPTDERIARAEHALTAGGIPPTQPAARHDEQTLRHELHRWHTEDTADATDEQAPVNDGSARIIERPDTGTTR